MLEIELNGVRLDPATAVTGARIALPGLAADNTVRVVAECAYSRTGEGLHRFTDPVDGSVYLYTQHEPRDAMRVFSCFDQPDLKATFQLTVTAPADWQVVSNSPTPEPQPLVRRGRPLGVRPDGAHLDLHHGARRRPVLLGPR